MYISNSNNWLFRWTSKFHSCYIVYYLMRVPIAMLSRNVSLPNTNNPPLSFCHLKFLRTRRINWSIACLKNTTLDLIHNGSCCTRPCISLRHQKLFSKMEKLSFCEAISKWLLAKEQAHYRSPVTAPAECTPPYKRTRTYTYHSNYGYVSLVKIWLMGCFC